jgi:hypothetical protein
MNADDVVRHEMDEPGLMNYEVVTNEHGVGVAVYVGTGLGDGIYPVERASRRQREPRGSPRSGSGSSRIR